MNNTTQFNRPWHTLVFTDLDGSLLDHFDYNFQPAKALLTQLDDHQIPVIFTTSKTFDEVIGLRHQMNNHHPFIVENGAAIYLPKGYFPSAFFSSGDAKYFSASKHEGFFKVSLCEERRYWLELLEESKSRYPDQFKHFYEMGPLGIVKATGLTKEQAILANRREHSEPVLWQGSGESKQAFIQEMRKNGANIEEGGRFLHLIGHCNKGKALSFLTQCYQLQQSHLIETIALGDGKNDIPMLTTADRAILIRSPVHPFPKISEHKHLIKSDHYGPHGWAEGLQKTLKQRASELDMAFDFIDSGDTND